MAPENGALTLLGRTEPEGAQKAATAAVAEDPASGDDASPASSGSASARLRGCAQLRGRQVALPYDRPWRDVFWLVLFLAATAGWLGYGAACGKELVDRSLSAAHGAAVEARYARVQQKREEMNKAKDDYNWAKARGNQWSWQGLFGGHCDEACQKESKHSYHRARQEHEQVQEESWASDVAWEEALGLPAASLKTYAAIATFATCSSLVASLLFVALLQRAPTLMVWAALIAGPCGLMLLGGLLYNAVNEQHGLAGLIVVALASVWFLSLCCLKHRVPFTVKLVEVVADVIQQHPGMMAVSVVGTVVNVAWVWLVGGASACILHDAVTSLDSTKVTTAMSLAVPATLLLAWGREITGNLCHVTYCGVFGRWYYEDGASSSSASSGSDAGSKGFLLPSLRVALTTSLGSICLGSLVITLVREAQKRAKRALEEAQAGCNPCCCICALCVDCAINCIGQVLAYLSDWAYVQCAVRGVSFCEAARITVALMMSSSNRGCITSDLLVDSVTSMGAIGVAAFSGLATVAGALVLSGSDDQAAPLVGLVAGLVAGHSAGSAALCTVSSGVKTMLVCWTDDPEALAASHPEVHEALEERLAAKPGHQ